MIFAGLIVFSTSRQTLAQLYWFYIDLIINGFHALNSFCLVLQSYVQSFIVEVPNIVGRHHLAGGAELRNNF